MNIFNVLKDTLQSPMSPIPCVPIVYSGTAKTYIVYSYYNSKGAAFAEITTELARDYYVQVDLYSTTLQPDLTEKIKGLLTSNGFYNPTDKPLYEPDTSMYHTIIQTEYIDQHS